MVKTKITLLISILFFRLFFVFGGGIVSAEVNFNINLTTIYGTDILSIIQKFWILIFPLVIFILMFNQWKKSGQDPKEGRTIVPQYDVPDGLTPLHVDVIMNEKVSNQSISAELIYLATQGYLKIEQKYAVLEPDKDFLNSKKDYKFTLIKGLNENMSNFDMTLLRTVFGRYLEIDKPVYLSDLNIRFHNSNNEIKRQIVENLIEKGYYKNLPNYFKAKSPILLFLINYAPFIIILLALFFQPIIEHSGISVVILSFILSFITLFVFRMLMPAKTEKGLLAKEHLLGLKEYLQIAEKDRLNFHNSPQKRPELFEKLLPYAMVLGVESKWEGEFKDVYNSLPDWYSSSTS